ncbi:MAG: glycosyltransferase [Planctomycetota bacterium]|nr:glycosyltransferase [Planctomycetota bacterium]
MRVLHIITRLNVGGATRAITNLLPYLEGDKTLIYGEVEQDEADMSSLLNFLDCSTIKLLKLPSLCRSISSKDLSAYRSLLHYLKLLKPDIVHPHLSKAGFLGRLAAWRAGLRRTVHTYHGNIFESHFGGLRSRVFLAVERALAAKTSSLVAVSQTLRKRLSKLLGIRSRWSVIPPPVCFKFHSSAHRCHSKNPFGLDKNRLVLGFLGRLVAVKNPLFLVDVLKHLGEKWILLVGGDGPLKTAVEKKAVERGVRGQVKFAGWVNDIESFYEACDVFATTSESEGFGFGIVEALYFGVPNVALAATGVADVMNAPLLASEDFIKTDSGWVVYKKNPQIFAKCVLEAYKENKRDFSTALKRILEICSPSTVAEEYNTLYRDLMRRIL